MGNGKFEWNGAPAQANRGTVYIVLKDTNSGGLQESLTTAKKTSVLLLPPKTIY